MNTSGYHPQSDGLVKKFNSTIITKVAETGKDWDCHLSFVLLAYRMSVQESTKESPFYLLYGRDARLPSESGWCKTWTMDHGLDLGLDRGATATLLCLFSETICKRSIIVATLKSWEEPAMGTRLEIRHTYNM